MSAIDDNLLLAAIADALVDRIDPEYFPVTREQIEANLESDDGLRVWQFLDVLESEIKP